MYNQYNLEVNGFDCLISSFKRFLNAEKISKGSVRSYLSDVRHFLGWLILFLQANKIISQDLKGLNLSQYNVDKVQPFSKREDKGNKGNEGDKGELEIIFLLKHVNERVLNDYKIYLTSNNVPLKTINRRFSSLRRFGDFCQSQNWVRSNPFDALRNISLNQPFPEDKFHLGEFRTELWKKGLTKISLKNYLADVKQFLNWEVRVRSGK